MLIGASGCTATTAGAAATAGALGDVVDAVAMAAGGAARPLPDEPPPAECPDPPPPAFSLPAGMTGGGVIAITGFTGGRDAGSNEFLTAGSATAGVLCTRLETSVEMIRLLSELAVESSPRCGIARFPNRG
jgi:hypothetical protein